MSDTGEAREQEGFIVLLEAIREILLRHDYMAQATWVADMIDLAHMGSSDFAKKLGGGAMWGSAGSVADIVDLRPSPESRDAKTEQDSFELQSLLVQLAGLMKAQGISSEGSEFVAHALRLGLERRRRQEHGSGR